VLSWQLKKAAVYVDNFFYFAKSGVKRRPPITLIERETELKLYIGAPFKDFTRRDWNEFWNLVYGAFLKENPEDTNLPKKMRQLTEEEIAQKLTSFYPMPFSFFQERAWQSFFQILFKNEARS
jgi:hypothetical protein